MFQKGLLQQAVLLPMREVRPAKPFMEVEARRRIGVPKFKRALSVSWQDVAALSGSKMKMGRQARTQPNRRPVGVGLSALQGETIAVPADDAVRHVVDLLVAALREQLCYGF